MRCLTKVRYDTVFFSSHFLFDFPYSSTRNVIDLLALLWRLICISRSTINNRPTEPASTSLPSPTYRQQQCLRPSCNVSVLFQARLRSAQDRSNCGLRHRTNTPAWCPFLEVQCRLTWHLFISRSNSQEASFMSARSRIQCTLLLISTLKCDLP